MIYELVYTSAPAGLRPGSSGYCTVQSSRGIPAPTVDLLESLSGYRHVYTAGTPEAANNPVNYGHYMLRVQGRQEHVLSRVSDCALDHTGRSNKLGHHMVIDNPDAIPGGPAWLLQQPGWMVNSWDGSVKLLDKARNAPATARPAAPCKTWQNVTGDAGWAGVLAETFLADPGRKVFLIYQPGVDILALFEEAIALLPVSRRWDVTFSTYGAALPATVDCLWTGVISGTQEEHLSKRFVHALRIDLTKAIGAAPETGKLVSVARTGKTTATATTSPPAERPVIAASGIPMTTDDVVADRHNLMPQAHTTPGKLTNAPPPVRRTIKRGSTGNGRLILIVIACVIFFGVGTVTSLLYLLKKPGSLALANNTDFVSTDVYEQNNDKTPDVTAINEDEENERKTEEIESPLFSKAEINTTESTNAEESMVAPPQTEETNSREKGDKKKQPKEDKQEENIPKLVDKYLYPASAIEFSQNRSFALSLEKGWFNGISLSDKVNVLFPVFKKHNAEKLFIVKHTINGNAINIQLLNNDVIPLEVVTINIVIDGPDSSFNVKTPGNPSELQLAFLSGCGVNFKSDTNDSTVIFYRPINSPPLHLPTSLRDRGGSKKPDKFIAKISQNPQAINFLNYLDFSDVVFPKSVNISGEGIEVPFRRNESNMYLTENDKVIGGSLTAIFVCENDNKSETQLGVFLPDFNDLENEIKNLQTDVYSLQSELSLMKEEFISFKGEVSNKYPSISKDIDFGIMINVDKIYSSNEDYKTLVESVDKAQKLLSKMQEKSSSDVSKIMDKNKALEEMNKATKRMDNLREYLKKRVELWNVNKSLDDKNKFKNKLELNGCTLSYRIKPVDASIPTKTCKLIVFANADTKK